MGNSVGQLAKGNALGSDNGAGFGWKNVDVYKLGAIYQVTPQLDAKAGYSYSSQPIPSDETFFNILAPGVVQTHWSLGGGYKFDDNRLLQLAYTYAPKKWV